MRDNEYILPRPPASDERIEAAERRLGAAFPAELRALLRELDGDGYLFLSADAIAENNLRLRDELGECYDDMDTLLLFAANGCGDYYAYTLAGGEANRHEIVRWEHEDNARVAVAKDLLELIERYYGDEI